MSSIDATSVDNINTVRKKKKVTSSIWGKEKDVIKAKRFLFAIEDKLLDNECEIKERDNAKYTILTVQDIMDWPLVKYHFKCPLCYLHGAHTPCGTEFNKWTECTTKEKSNENKSDKCADIFNKEFYPCFAPLFQTPYYQIRSQLLYFLPLRDTMDYWFRMQKRKALDAVYLKNPQHHH
jgi:hypothetical protein